MSRNPTYRSDSLPEGLEACSAKDGTGDILRAEGYEFMVLQPATYGALGPAFVPFFPVHIQKDYEYLTVVFNANAPQRREDWSIQVDHRPEWIPVAQRSVVKWSPTFLFALPEQRLPYRVVIRIQREPPREPLLIPLIAGAKWRYFPLVSLSQDTQPDFPVCTLP